MKRISISTYFGLAIGLLCVISGIYGAGNINSFVNIPSILIIIGGTTGALIMSFPGEQLKTLGIVFYKAFTGRKNDYKADIKKIVEVATISRKSGILVLEQHAKDYDDDPFFQKGLLLIADGYNKDVFIKALKSDIFYMKKRHKVGHAMMDMIADSVTSLGLLGTYIGLIPMLEHLEDPASLGPLMAIELVSSFYGAFLSYVIFGPLSNRLKAMSSSEVVHKTLIIDGLCEIIDGTNPKMIEELLIASLTKKQIKKLKKGKEVDIVEKVNYNSI